jgi:hypothetical protein
MKIHLKIKECVNKKGAEIIVSNILIGMLDDEQVFDDVEAVPYKKILRNIIKEGYAQKLLDLGSYTPDVNFLASQYASKNLMQEPPVLYVLDCLAYGLGWMDKEPTMQVVATPPQPPTTETSVSVTSNCDCTFTCDGKSQGKLSPGDVKMVNVNKGEHIFVFTSKDFPKVSVTKVLNCPSMTETYTLVEKDLFKKVQDALNKKKEKSQQLRSNLRQSIKFVGVLVALVACGFGIYYFVDWMRKEIKEKEKQEKIEIQNRSLKDAGISVDDFSFDENASKNGLRGIEITLTLECEKKCNTLAKTVITICDKKKTPYPAKDEDFSDEGNCAIVSLDTISSEKHILKKFIPFRSLPKVQRVKGSFFEEYGFWCNISIMDKNDECVYTSNEELLFEKPADYDKLYAKDVGISVNDFSFNENASKNGLRGIEITLTLECEKKCNTLAKTIITICDKKKSPYPAKDEGFSYEGNCAIVSLDTISSEKHILKKFIPFRSLPKVQRVKGFFSEEYGFWCNISIMDKNDECVYTSYEELLFEKPADYDKLYASVSVDKVWVDYNVYQDGAKGMLIHVKFDVANALGEICRCVAYFYKVDGSKLKDTNNRFCTDDGQVSTSEFFSPGYASTYYGDFSFFMPISELHVNSKNDLYFELVFYICHSDGKYEEIGRYSKVTFTYDV